MTLLKATVAASLLISSVAFANRGSKPIDDPKTRNQGGRAAVVGGQASPARIAAVKNLVDNLKTRGLVGASQSARLTDILNNSNVELKSFKLVDGKRMEETFKLIDIANNLSSRAQSLTQGQKHASIALIALLSSPRGQDSALVNKLAAELNAMLEPSSKATEAELKSYADKAIEAVKLVNEGTAKTVDEAMATLFTKEKREELENCRRG